MGDPIREYRLAKEIFRHGRDLILSDEAQKMKSFTQHGMTSVFEHTISVAKYSLKMANVLEKLGAKIDRRSLVRGAILHDYFLYDWHDKTVPGRRVHGFTHPTTARKNAERDFNINDLEKDIISKHMFPVTPFPPMHRESVIVNLADKWCALCETFKVDVSSYIIYRVNFNIALAEGEYSIDYGETKAEY